MLRSLPFCLLAGCIVPAYHNGNNGHDGELGFVLPEGTLAVGERIEVPVSHEGEMLDWCLPVPNGPCDGHSDFDRSTLAQLIDAHCDGPCQASIDGGKVELWGTGDGDGTLHVTVLLANGEKKSDSIGVSFLTARFIRLSTCEDSCGLRYAVFPGATMKLGFTVQGKRGDVVIPLQTSTPFEVTGAATEMGDSEQVVPRERTLSLLATAPGWVTVHWKIGSVERSLRLRVASEAEVVDGAAYYSASPHWTSYVQGDEEYEVAPSQGPYYVEASLWFYVGWRLRDGTLALGGAGRVVSTPAVASLRTIDLDAAHDPVVDLASRRVFFYASSAGRYHFGAQVGSAQLDFDPELVDFAAP